MSGGSVFLTNNNTEVVAHRGSTTTLQCQVVKDSQYGVVSSIKLKKSIFYQFYLIVFALITFLLGIFNIMHILNLLFIYSEQRSLPFVQFAMGNKIRRNLTSSRINILKSSAFPQS